MDEELNHGRLEPERESGEKLSRQDQRDEERAAILMSEQDVLDEMLGIAKEQKAQTEVIDVVTKQGRRMFFRVGVLEEETDTELRRKCTTYERKAGIRIPKETDVTTYRSMQIVEATITFCVPEALDENDQPIGFRDLGQNLWKNKQLRESLGVRSNAAVVDAVLLPGQKDEILERIEKLSGYNDDDDPEKNEQIELAKN